MNKLPLHDDSPADDDSTAQASTGSFKPAEQIIEAAPASGLIFLIRGSDIVLSSIDDALSPVVYWTSDETTHHETDNTLLSSLTVLHLGSFGDQAIMAGSVDKDAPLPDDTVSTRLRYAWYRLPEQLREAAVYAQHMTRWRLTNRYCGRCGTEAGWHPEHRALLCPSCKLESWPRISPAIIVSIRREDEILLVKSKKYSSGTYSVPAGFLEPGETLEQCVHREIMEETGVKIHDLQYFGSQPWPYPDALMVAFTASYESGELHRDEHELTDVGWYTATTLPRPLTELPSIARRLIDHFLENQ